MSTFLSQGYSYERWNHFEDDRRWRAKKVSEHGNGNEPDRQPGRRMDRQDIKESNGWQSERGGSTL